MADALDRRKGSHAPPCARSTKGRDVGFQFSVDALGFGRCSLSTFGRAMTRQSGCG